MATAITMAAAGRTIFGSQGSRRNNGVISSQKVSLRSCSRSWTPSRTGSAHVAGNAHELLPVGQAERSALECQGSQPDQQDQAERR